MMRVINILALGNFASALTFRCLDPVLPQIAQDTGVDVHAAASLLTAFALPYALIQPTLGAAGDLFGKTRIMRLCLILLCISCAAGAFAPSFEMLFVARVAMGAAAGGIFPLTLALAGDLVPIADRQAAVGRLIATTVSGTLLGSLLGGVIADAIDWRAILIAMAGLIVIVTVTIFIALRPLKLAARHRTSLAGLIKGYGEIFRNPQTWIVYPTVFFEGMCVHGLFSFVAAILAGSGETRASIAGLVIAAFAVGGLTYSLSVRWILDLVRVNPLMLICALIVAATLVLAGLNPHWTLQLAIYFIMGVAFYALHGSLQIFGSELAPSARGSAIALFASSLFLGQAAGPFFYGPGLDHFGVLATLVLAALIIAALGVLVAARLHHRESAL